MGYLEGQKNSWFPTHIKPQTTKDEPKQLGGERKKGHKGGLASLYWFKAGNHSNTR